MRNVWRGLAVGALVGAFVGILLDMANRTKRAFSDSYESTRSTVREHGPEAVAALKGFAAHAVEQVREADIPAKVKDAASTAADKASEFGEVAAEKVSGVAGDASDKAGEVAEVAAEKAKAASGAAAQKAKDLRS